MAVPFFEELPRPPPPQPVEIDVFTATSALDEDSSDVQWIKARGYVAYVFYFLMDTYVRWRILF